MRQDQLGSVAKRYGWPIGGALVLALAGFGGYLFWSDQQRGGSSSNVRQADHRARQARGGPDRRRPRTISPRSPRAAPPPRSPPSWCAPASPCARTARPKRSSCSTRSPPTTTRRSPIAISPRSARSRRSFEQAAAAAGDRPAEAARQSRAIRGSAAPASWSAMAYLKQGKQNLAGPLFAAIAKDEDVPQTLRSRTRQMAGLLGYDAVVDVDETLAELRDQETAAGRARPPAAGPVKVDRSMMKTSRRPGRTVARVLLLPLLVAALAGVRYARHRRGQEGRRHADARQPPADPVAHRQRGEGRSDARQRLGRAAAGADQRRMAAGRRQRRQGARSPRRSARRPVRAWTATHRGQQPAPPPRFRAGGRRRLAVRGRYRGRRSMRSTPRPARGAGRMQIEVERDLREPAFGGGASFFDGKVYATNGAGDVVALDASDRRRDLARRSPPARCAARRRSPSTPST